jgi:phospho-N-acetylmuramoyl-pentapeptide-transferase
MAFFSAFVLVLVFQPYFIRWLKRRQFGDQPIRSDGPESHQSKKGTPTMGGVVVVGAVIFSTLLFAELGNRFVWISIGILLSFSWLGFMDDYRKVTKQDSKGMSARSKFLVELLLAGAFSSLLIFGADDFSTMVSLPFFKNAQFDLGWFFVPFAVLVIVGSANAVNLTDGLDGLVTGPIMTTALAYGVFAYTCGNVRIAKYLQISYVAGVGDLAIIAAAVVGAGMGFLWFNSYPAQVFMGDVGSLGLGSLLGTLAVITKQELVLPLAGAVFVIETLSVMIQVGSFKLTGKRVFRMAPIHHHFELKGLAEPKIIVRCWIMSIVLALLSLATLKLR